MWYLIWFFTVQGPNGAEGHTIESRELMVSEFQCNLEMNDRLPKLEKVFGETRWIYDNPTTPRSFKGKVVGVTIGCEQRDDPWRSKIVIGEANYVLTLE